MHLVNALERKHLYIVVKSVPIREQHTSFTSCLNRLLGYSFGKTTSSRPKEEDFIRLYTFRFDLDSLTSNRTANHKPSTH